MSASRPHQCSVPPGVTGHWRGHGAGVARAYRHFLAWVARAWRGHGAGVARACPVTPGGAGGNHHGVSSTLALPRAQAPELDLEPEPGAPGKARATPASLMPNRSP
eukprot:gene14988-biopygen9683